MKLAEGYFYETYIDSYIIGDAMDWRRVEPLIFRCAELNKLDTIQRIVNQAMEKLMYCSKLFNTAEKLLTKKLHATAILLYEGVAEGERFHNYFVLFLNDMAYYNLIKGNLETGFNYLLICLKKSYEINNKPCIIKCVGLFESFRGQANQDVEDDYQNTIKEVYKYEKR
ncbi:hypothetical protein [Paenibacillus sp. FSL K6-1230]|uniref:hypothetical protein n=1 Tax=Paenibacillus sp. FSL K6-1230 TaxID=2921603 RepID=UPI0030FCAACB